MYKKNGFEMWICEIGWKGDCVESVEGAWYDIKLESCEQLSCGWVRWLLSCFYVIFQHNTPPTMCHCLIGSPLRWLVRTTQVFVCVCVWFWRVQNLNGNPVSRIYFTEWWNLASMQMYLVFEMCPRVLVSKLSDVAGGPGDFRALWLSCSLVPGRISIPSASLPLCSSLHLTAPKG